MPRPISMRVPPMPSYFQARGVLYLPDADGLIHDVPPEHVEVLRLQGCSEVPGTVPLPETPGLVGIPWSATGADHPGTGVEMHAESAPSGEYLPPPDAPVQPSVPDDQQAISTNG